MARPYSERFLLDLNKADPTRIGVQLGKVCVKANLPTSYVAKAFDVSRMSIHSWFRGQYIREKNYIKIDKFIKLVEEAMQNGELPVEDIAKAKEYIDTKVINRI